jgi:hypothetical protein
MRRLLQLPILVALLMLGGTQGAEAQIGGILDWISRLSGPGVLRGGIQYAIPVTNDGTLTISPAVMAGGKVRDGDGVDGSASLAMYTGQITVDVAVLGRGKPTSLMISSGAAGHWFSGSAFDNFGSFSIPAFAIIRHVFSPGGNQIRFGTGFNFFRFGSTAFDPIDVGVKKEEWEGAFGLNLAILIKL